MPDLSMVVDVVDRNNKPIATATRADLFVRKQNFRTVHVILRDEQDRFCLQKLPHDHRRSPGKLGSSAAGYLKAGETYSEAARRKLRAELGLETTLQDQGEFTMVDESSKKFIAVFTGRSGATPAFDPHEIETLVYLHSQELRSHITLSPVSFTQTFRCLYEAKKHIFV